MSLSTIDFSATFDLTASTKEIIITDLTDYAGESVTGASGAITVTSPTGSTITDTIADPLTTATNGGTIAIPLDSGGNVVTGTYTVLYTVTESAPGSDVVALTQTFDFSYASPTISLDVTVDCIKPELKSVDKTSYTQVSTTPTIVRAHTIFYPASLEVTDATGTSATLTTSTFYTTQHSAKLVSTLTYNVSTQYIILDEVSGTKTLDVTCDDTLCDLYCCIKAEHDRYTTYKNTNDTLYRKHLANYMHIVAIGWELSQAVACGKTADVSTLSNEILDLANCEAGCGCKTDAPVQVVGIQGSGSGTVVVQTGGTPITVTSAVDGDTTTYSISIDSTFVAKVNNSYNSTVTAGTGISITTTTDGDGNKTYEVANSNTTSSNILAFNLLVDFTSAASGSIPTLTIKDISSVGSAFASSGVTILNNQTSNGTWLANDVGFTISDIWDSRGSKVYKASIQVANQIKTNDGFYNGSAPVLTSADAFANVSLVRAEIVSAESPVLTSLSFRLLDISDGGIMQGTKCKNMLKNMLLHVILTA